MRRMKTVLLISHNLILILIILVLIGPFQNKKRKGATGIAKGLFEHGRLTITTRLRYKNIQLSRDKQWASVWVSEEIKVVTFAVDEREILDIEKQWNLPKSMLQVQLQSYCFVYFN